MPKFTTIVADGETVIGIEVDREIRRSIDLVSLIVSNGLAGYEDRLPDLVTVKTADGRYHKGGFGSNVPCVDGSGLATRICTSQGWSVRPYVRPMKRGSHDRWP